MPSRAQRFAAKILKQGPNSYVRVPRAVSAAFERYAEKGRIRVHGTLDGAEIRGTLVPRRGGHCLFLHAGMRAAADVGVGDVVELVLRATPWEQVPTANDVRIALKKAGALADFEAKSPSHRHEMLRWVEMAESPRQRAKRLAELVDQLRGQPEPAKKGQAAKRLKPLWTCPQCGHVFVNRNQRHSCKRFELDESFSRSDPLVREIFDRVRAMVESVGPVNVQAYRDHVAFVVRVRFLGATPRKKWLDLAFRLPRRIDHSRFHKVETLSPTDHVHLLRLTDEDQLDVEVMDWIREGYAVGEQKHLAWRQASREDRNPPPQRRP